VRKYKRGSGNADPHQRQGAELARTVKERIHQMALALRMAHRDASYVEMVSLHLSSMSRKVCIVMLPKVT